MDVCGIGKRFNRHDIRYWIDNFNSCIDNDEISPFERFDMPTILKVANKIWRDINK